MRLTALAAVINSAGTPTCWPTNHVVWVNEDVVYLQLQRQECIMIPFVSAADSTSSTSTSNSGKITSWFVNDAMLMHLIWTFSITFAASATSDTPT